MAKQSRKKTPPKKSVVKKRNVGRPRSTGAGEATMVRMHKPQLQALDSWIGEAGLTRPEAIRQLVTWALEHTKPKEAPPDEPSINVVKRARQAELGR